MNNDNNNVDRNKMSVTQIIDFIMQPQFEFLVKNYNNPNAVNACLDIAGDGIRTLTAISEQCKQYLKDFENLRKLVIACEKSRGNIIAVPGVTEMDNEQEENVNN